ncbi:MAG: CDP-alcohol phosphatidyltransferase family protein [Thermoplasmata archaeon]|nr:CDP-alcohol phosphatidyltransferase family protein [Thermoplasmata archaeon]
MTPLRKLSAADLVTLANALLGFLAITYVVDGRYALAGLLVFVAIILDGLDGALARRFGTGHQFGRYLDFFADSVSFCFAPATLIYTVTYDISRGPAWMSWENSLAVVIPTFYVCMGLLRLARFAEEGYQKPYFEGLPTPAAAYLAVTVYLLLGRGAALESGSQLSVLIVMAFAGGSMMMTSLKYPKLQRSLVAPSLAGILSMVVAALLIVVDSNDVSVSYFLTLFGISLIAVYILFGPLYSRRRGSP